MQFIIGWFAALTLSTQGAGPLGVTKGFRDFFSVFYMHQLTSPIFFTGLVVRYVICLCCALLSVQHKRIYIS
ncbi:hypothetical protein BJY04DRAFT_153576 [Aspergillus karnatakaensis]|uniref:uncharacterized protein n=1 Tax=Aspergillus karnatakaensis TaxID=1810916 RepID=UPI003CCE0493